MENKLITREAWIRFFDLRQRLLEAIDHYFTVQTHCKSDEGRFIFTSFARQALPSYFEEKEPDGEEIELELYCYVIGPGSYYKWNGSTLTEALDKAEPQINEWIAKHHKEYPPGAKAEDYRVERDADGKPKA